MVREKALSSFDGALPASGERRRHRHPGPHAAEFDAWRRSAVRRLADLLALSPAELDPTAARIDEVSTSRPKPHLVALHTGGDSIPAWLLVPVQGRSNGAAVVALAGHGPGIDALVDDAAPAGDYHGGLARKLQAAGFTVLCPELASFGRRRTPGPTAAENAGQAENSCQVDAMRGLLTGRPVLGRRVAEACAALAAVRTLPEVDPTRVAVLGGSGGGAVALFAAALDDRIPVAVVANYISSFADSLCSVPHCICNAIPDLLTWFEMVDVAAMLAPRGLIVEAGSADPIFPIDATRAAHAELVDLWSALGATPPDLVTTEAGHQFLADAAIAALSARLGLSPPSPTSEGAQS